MAWRVKTPSPMYAAITATAGNVLFTGDLEGNFLALDARSGKELYRFNTGGPIAGGVVTWEQKAGSTSRSRPATAGIDPVSGSTTIVVFGQ
jgi:alcohol dehydrogenase (cytochrome c)